MRSRWQDRGGEGLSGEASNSPVGQHERIAELLDTLVMGGVARDQFQAVCDGDGGDHRVAATDRSADTFQIAVDLACQSAFGLAERQNFLAADVSKEFLDAADALIPLEAGNDFHDGDGG